MWTKKENETEYNYKLRIYKLKQADPSVATWEEITDKLNEELGYDFSESKYRKEAKRMLTEALYREVVLKEESQKEEQEEFEEESLESVLLQIKKEQVKARDERTQANAIIRELAREEVYKDIANEAVEKIAQAKLLTMPDKIVLNNKEKIGLLCIGDWHYGLDVDIFYNQYNPDIAKARVSALCERVVKIIKSQGLNELYIINMGDMISGRIHLPLRLNSRIDAVTQTMEVSEILAEFLHYLSLHVIIHYGSVEDNHSRIEPNKRDSLQTESFARVINWYLAERLKDNPNIVFLQSNIGPDILQFNIFNHTIAAVHGDRDPQKGIVDKLNSYLQKHLDMIVSAHLHHFSADENNYTEFYCNGSLIGQDQYASDLRLNSKPSQLMFIITPENVSEVLYKIKL